ncbi:MAG: hypothetical protein N3G21_01655 [Candidatus Hydrogenedentes bacterium]|nr:hypothetical protein [Candidatus Hydrogenedentota bacterium]
MKQKSLIIIAGLVIIYIIVIENLIVFAQESTKVSPEEPQSINTQIKITEAQPESDQEKPQIEIHVKDNKTQQTSTVFFPSNERLFKELQEIKITLQQLQQTVDYLVNHVIADLEEENQQLRESLRLYNIAPSQNLEKGTTKFIPGIRQTMPDKILHSEETSSIEDNATPQDAKIESSQEFYFRVIEEWGRDPEVLKQLNSSAPTVKGIVAVVPPNTPREKLEELAKELRTKYEKYDNINIEVFDNEESARAFADRHERDPEHNVLSVSRHKESGRDLIVVYGLPITNTESSTANPSNSPKE